MERAPEVHQPEINFNGVALTVKKVKKQPSLETASSISMVNCHSDEWTDIISLLHLKCPQLRKLNLNGSCIGDKAIIELLQMSSLTDLSMGTTSAKTKIIAACPSSLLIDCQDFSI